MGCQTCSIYNVQNPNVIEPRVAQPPIVMRNFLNEISSHTPIKDMHQQVGLVADGRDQPITSNTINIDHDLTPRRSNPLQSICQPDSVTPGSAKRVRPSSRNRAESYITERDRPVELLDRLLLEQFSEEVKNNQIDPGYQNERKETLLHIMTRLQRAEVLVHLGRWHKEDIDVNIQDVNGNTPMHLAIMLENRDEVLALKKYFGSSIDEGVRNKQGDSIQDLFKEKALYHSI